MIKIAPSILSSDFSKLGEEVSFLDSSSADYIHIDVMDGHFVPNLTIGPPVIKSLRRLTEKIFDVHLMMTYPNQYIEAFVDAGSDIISIHVESKCDIRKTLKQIKDLGKKAGVVYNPSTDLGDIQDYFEYIDQILLMSVYPGFSGQKFIKESLARGLQVKNLLNRMSLKIDLEIDGGVGIDNYKEIINSGYNVLVAGSSIYNATDKNEMIQRLKSV